jgi:hypothetical protein
MPTIQILFDDSVVSEEQVLQLGNALRDIALGADNLHDVSFAFAYGESPKIKIGLAPLEVYIKITRWKITDEKALSAEFREKLTAWKQEVHYPHPVNILLMPMDWLIEDNI